VEDIAINDEEPAAYEVNSPRVMGETVDGETVLIDSRSGAYYSLNESGSHIWSALQDGPTTVGAIGAALAALYGMETEAASEATSSLIASLCEHELIRVTHGAPATALSIAPLGPAPLVFTEPMLERFDDLEDLLLLDPIHDVDPERGWPIAKAADRED
jgi:hypothetical protein